MQTLSLILVKELLIPGTELAAIKIVKYALIALDLPAHNDPPFSIAKLSLSLNRFSH